MYLPAYIPTYLRTYLLTYMQTDRQTDIHTADVAFTTCSAHSKADAPKTSRYAPKMLMDIDICQANTQCHIGTGR